MFNNIQLGIDELFDLRTACYQVALGDRFVELLDLGYGQRLSDRYDSLIPYADYLDIYEKRGLEELRNSSITAILPFLKAVTMSRLELFKQNPTHKSPTIYLNIPPRYPLTDAEISSIGCNLLDDLDLDIPLKILKQVLPTPLTLKANEIGSFFVYDLPDWMGRFANEVVIDIQSMTPQTTVYFAKVHTAEQPYDGQAIAKALAALKKDLKTMMNIEAMAGGLFSSPILNADIQQLCRSQTSS